MHLRSFRASFLPPLALAPLALALAGGAPAGCSATQDTGEGGASATSGTTSTTTTSTATTTTTTDDAGSGGSGGGGIELDAGVTDAPLGDAETCASTSVEAKLISLDMLIVLDRSGSMSGSNWDGATAALQAFVADPASSGMSVGIVYFPVDDPPDDDDCNHKHYQAPDVDFGELPANKDALSKSIEDEEPEGGSTPIYGALKGALFAATARQDELPDHKVVVVFASDGDPNSCPDDQNDIPVIAALAQSALNYNGVQTYVIAIQGASLSNLNQIAAAGGTTAAFDVTGNIQQFSDKMAEIRKQALACELPIPPPPEEEQFDPNKVNVAYLAGGQPPEQLVPKADGLADCAGSAGWYYDNEAEPTKIILCPASCNLVQSDGKAKVSVKFGCKTEIN